METKTKNKPETVVITGKRTRLAYCCLFERRGFKGEEPKFSARLIIPKTDARTMKLIFDAMTAAYEEGIEKLRGNAKKAPPMKEIRSPLYDGDLKRSEDPIYRDRYYMNANSYDPPYVFGKDGKEVFTRGEVYSGCYARCKIQFFCYNWKDEEKGIGVKLLGLRKVSDGEPLRGARCSAADFEIDEEEACWGDGE